MFSAYWRHGLVVTLALLASAAAASVHIEAQRVTLPAIGALLAHTEWRVVRASSQGSSPGMQWGLWQVRDRAGRMAYLYVGTTNAVQKMVHWSGEYAYEGAGYQIVNRTQRTVSQNNGRVIACSVVTVQRGADRQLLVYAVASPHRITAHATDDLLGVAWDVVRGDGGLYYLVRVSIPVAGMPGGTSAEAAIGTGTQVLAGVLAATSG